MMLKCYICLVLLSLSQPSHSANILPRSGFIDINVYPYLSDVDNDNSITINSGVKLTDRFSYFSLTNFSNQDSTSALGDLNNFYTEQNIRWKLSDNSPFDLTLQMNFRSGEDNDRHRLGVRWRLNDSKALRSFFNEINLFYAVNFHLLQFDHEPASVWQIEHTFRMKFPSLDNKLYIAGFVDHTFNQNLPSNMPSSPIVGEIQLGYQLSDRFFLIGEYRVNQYRRSDVNNLAIGFEYLMKW